MSAVEKQRLGRALLYMSHALTLALLVLLGVVLLVIVVGQL